MSAPDGLKEALGVGRGLEELYNGLSGLGQERANAFLRRLHSRVQAALEAFTQATGSWACF